ncbi:MAG: ribose-phosphate diphosphokinase [Thermoplasmatales archaeon]|nr:ribose-phosphate diphosphokinase [Thermoplasmatales archaeon]
MLVVSSSSSETLASKLSELLHSKLSEVERKRFPDGEMYVRVLADMKGEKVAVIGSTKNDADLIELLLLLNACREAGAGKIIAVVPYFGYARQHRTYNDGEPVSSKVMTKCIEQFSDEIICVEIHDEETLTFASKPFRNISVIDTMSKHFLGQKIDYVLAPDDGAFDRAQKMAEIIGTRAYYIDKKRIDSKTVDMHLPNLEYMGKSVLLVDDIISTGGTIIRAVNLLKDRGVSKISVSAVHGVFARESDKTITSLVDDLVVSDTIEGPNSTVSVAENISRSLRG